MMPSLQTKLQHLRGVSPPPIVHFQPNFKLAFGSQRVAYVCCRTDAMGLQRVCSTQPEFSTSFQCGRDIVMDMRVVDFRKAKKSRLILVVEDVYETRAGIDTLLKATGYRVVLASAEQEVKNSTRPDRPNLILVSGAGLPNNVLVTVSRIRKEAGVGDEIPVVIFCAQEVPEGEEVAIGGNVYLTNPDNFNQLRSLVARLLPESPHDDITDEEEQTLEIYDKQR